MTPILARLSFRSATSALALAILGGCGARAVELPHGMLVYESAWAHAFGTTSRVAAAPVESAPANLIFALVTRATPSARFVSPGQAIRLVAAASGAGNRPVTLQWSTTHGTLTSVAGYTSVWVAPAAPGDATILATANDGRDETSAAFRFTVR